MANYSKIQNAMSSIKNAITADNQPMPDIIKTIPTAGGKLLDGVDISSTCNMIYLSFRGEVKLRFDGVNAFSDSDPYHTFDSSDNPPFSLNLAKNICLKPNGESDVKVIISQFSY